MKLGEIYKKIANCIVSINLRSSLEQDITSHVNFNPILGTGFVIDESGIILTCGHVIDEIIKSAGQYLLDKINEKKADSIEKFKEGSDVNDLIDVKGKCPAFINFFINDGKNVYVCPCDIIRASKIQGIKTSWNRVCNIVPDIGLIEADVKDLEKVILCDDFNKIEIGLEVGTSGFPFGKDLMIGREVIDNNIREYIQQASPTLKRGIISAILPIKCERPELFLTDIMVQGGQSGSPLFLVDTGEVIGIVIQSMHQLFNYTYTSNSIEKNIQIPIPTGLSYSVPVHFLVNNLEKFKKDNSVEKKDLKFLLEENLKDGTKVYVK